MDTGVKTFRSLTDAVPALKSVDVTVKADAGTVLERESCCRVNDQQRVGKKHEDRRQPGLAEKDNTNLIKKRRAR